MEQKTQNEHEQLVAALAQLELLKSQQSSRISFKVSQPRKAGTNGSEDKGSAGGAVSLYGLGRFPVTLYSSQWEALIGAIPTLTDFLKLHKSELAVKPSAGPTQNGPVTMLKV